MEVFEKRELLAALPTVLVSTVIIILCVLLSSRQGQPSTAKQPASASTSRDAPFDISNLRVTKLLVHPIKSCKGTSVQEARYTLHGLQNDRKWCIIRADNHVVVTARQVSKLVLIHPHILADPLAPEGGRLQVTFPEDSGCETFHLPLNPSADTLQRWQSVDVELWSQKDIQAYVCDAIDGRSPSTILSEVPELQAPSYFQDGYPLLLVSEESVSAIQEQIRGMVGIQGVSEKWAKEALEVERFRPNIVFKGAGAPFLEDVVTELSISSDRDRADGVIQLVSKCTRCLLPNVDPSTGVRDDAVPYKVMMKFRKGLDPERAGAPCLGCNGAPVGAGVVRVGDWVHVRAMGAV